MNTKEQALKNQLSLLKAQVKDVELELSQMSKNNVKYGKRLNVKNASESEFRSVFKEIVLAEDDELEESDLSVYMLQEYSEYVLESLSWLEFSAENFEYQKSEGSFGNALLGYNSVGNISFWGMYAGGDWEYPIFFVVYLTADGILSAYIPVETNKYNRESDSAYGNNDDYAEVGDTLEPDWDAMKKEICEHLIGIQMTEFEQQVYNRIRYRLEESINGLGCISIEKELSIDDMVKIIDILEKYK